MPTSTKVKNLNINELTEAQYDAAVQGGVIGANELSVLTDVSYVEPSDLATVATTGDYSDLINRPTNLVSTNTAQTISGMKTFSGDITLSGTTSIKNNTGGTNYTMLYRDASTIHVGASTSVLKLEGSGTRPAYNNDSLALLSDITAELPSQTGHSGEFLTTDGTSVSWAAVSGGLLPSQTGNSGKFLTTDGTSPSWSDKPLVNRATGTNGIGIGGSSLVASGNNSIAVGPNPQATATGAIAIGVDARATVADGIAIGNYARSSANKAYQIGSGTNGTANSFQVGSHQLLNLSDGTIPEARLADTTNAQQGDVLTLDSTGNAVWQAGSGGSSYTAGTGIDITNGTISVTSPTLQNTATGNYSMCIGQTGSSASGQNSLAVGSYAQSTQRSVAVGAGAVANVNYTVAVGDQAGCYGGQGAVALGSAARANAANAIQISATSNVSVNSDANTMKVANANGNFEIMSADGTIPAARHAALPAADGTYTLQLVITNGVPTLSWVAV